MYRLRFRRINVPINAITFSAPYKISLVLDKGIIASTAFIRATTASVTDFESLLKTAKSGETRFVQARRVENINPKSEWDSGWTAAGTTPPTINATDVYLGKNCTSTTFAAGTYIIYSGSRAIGSLFPIKVGDRHTARFVVAADRVLTTDEIVTVQLNGTFSTVNLPFNATTNNFNTAWNTKASISNSSVGIAGSEYYVITASKLNSPITIYLSERQVENTIGQANQNPSEYVSNGVLSAPYHDAGVDGVKYFNTYNGNTVSSNVVTEATGAAIADNTLKGLLCEASRTNLNTYSSDLTNASYTKSNVTVAINATAPDGTTTANTLTVTATAATIVTKVITATSTKYTYSIFTKKGTKSTGSFLLRNSTTATNFTIAIFNYNTGIITGAGWLAEVYPNGWYRLSYTNTDSEIINIGNSLTIYCGFIGGVETAGDTVLFWGVQLETGGLSSYIPTVASQVVRNADVFPLYSIANIKTHGDTIFFVATPQFNNTAFTGYLLGSYIDTNNCKCILHDGTNLIFRKRTAGVNTDLTTPFTYSKDNKFLCAIAFGSGGMRLSVNGVLVSNAIDSTTFGTTFQFGADGNSQNQPFCTIKDIKIYGRKLKDGALQALTVV